MGWEMSSPSRGSHVPGVIKEGVRLGVTIENSEKNLGVSTPNATGLALRLNAGGLNDGEESRTWR